MSIIEKNTVNAEGQLKKSQFVSIHYPEASGIRVMFVGNSITLHGINHEIGWHWEHGMAASTAEKDYVHLVEKEVLKKHSDASFCVCQVAYWERNYKNGTEALDLYSDARNFDADIIIMRFCENCPRDDVDAENFKYQYNALLE